MRRPRLEFNLLFEQLRRPDLQGFRHPVEIVDRDVALASLDGRDIGRVDSDLTALSGRTFPQLYLNLLDDFGSRVAERRGEFEDRGKRGLLVSKFQNADIGSPQVGLQAELLLRHVSFLTQPAQHPPESPRSVQPRLPLLEELRGWE